MQSRNVCNFLIAALGVACLLLISGTERRSRNLATVPENQGEAIPSSCFLTSAPGDLWEVGARLTFAPPSTRNLSSTYLLSPVYTYGTGVDPHIFQDVSYLDPRCISLLQQMQQRTVRRYFLDPSHPMPIPYVASANRPYCGTPAMQTACTREVPWDPSVVIYPSQERVPPNMVPYLSVLADTHATTLPSMLFRGTELIFSQTTDRSAPLRMLYLGKRNNLQSYDEIVIRQGPLAFIKQRPRPTPDSTTDNLNATWRSRFEAIIESIGSDIIRRESQGDGLVPYLEYFEARNSSLSNYWAQGRTFLRDHYYDAHSPAIDLAGFQNDRNVLPSTAAGLSINVSNFSNSVVREASVTFTYSQDPDQILAAASAWWAARQLEIQIGCDLSRNQPFAGGVRLVERQYEHQSCRRHFAGEAFYALNRIVDDQGELHLDSREWTIVSALGSRKERASLFIRALPILARQVRRGTPLRMEDLSILVREFLQTEEELRRHQVLLWSGLQQFSEDSSDELQLIQFKAAFGNFLTNVSAWALSGNVLQPALISQLRTVWNWSYRGLGFPTWERQFPQFSGPAWSRTLITSSLSRDAAWQAQGGWGNLELQALYDESVALALHDPAMEPVLCRLWLQWVQRDRERLIGGQPLTLSPERDSTVQGGCLRIIPRWFRLGQRIVNPPLQTDSQSLQSQCTAGHHLSCLTSLAIERPADDLWTQWESILARRVLPIQIARDYLELLKAQVSSASSRGNIPLSMRQMLIHVASVWRSWLVEQSEIPLSNSEFRECVRPDRFQALLARVRSGVAIRTLEPTLELDPRCAPRLRNVARNWMVRLAILIHAETALVPAGDQRPPYVWEENIVSAAGRYALFESLFGPFLRRIPGQNVFANRSHALRLTRRLSSYLTASDLAVGETRESRWWLPRGDRGLSSTSLEIFGRAEALIFAISSCEGGAMTARCVEELREASSRANGL